MITIKDGIKFEVKAIKTWTGRDGYGLSCSLYVNGKKIGTVRDDANGGDIDYDWDFKKTKSGYELKNPTEIDILNKWIEKQPTQEVGKEFGAKSFYIPYSIDDLVDEMINKHEQEKASKKFEAKMKRQMKNMVLVGDPSKTEYTTYKFGNSVPLSNIPTHILQKYVTKYISELKKGEKILNTNLTSLGIVLK